MPKQLFSDDLLPYLDQDGTEEQAKRLLEAGYGFLYSPYSIERIEPIRIARALGIRVFFARLSEDDSIRGEYVYADTEALVYDDATYIGDTVVIRRRGHQGSADTARAFGAEHNKQVFASGRGSRRTGGKPP